MNGTGPICTPHGRRPSSIASRRLFTTRFALVPLFLFRPMHNRDKVIRRTLHVTENQNCGNLNFFFISLSTFIREKKAITMHFRYQNTGFSRIEIMRKPAIGNNRWGVSPYYWTCCYRYRKKVSQKYSCALSQGDYGHLFLFSSRKKKPLRCTFAIKTQDFPELKLCGNLPSEIFVFWGILNPNFHYLTNREQERTTESSACSI